MKRRLLSLVTLVLLIQWQANAQITVYPYFEDFESGAGGWTINPGGTWALGTPAGAVINSAASGTQAYVTNLTGLYNNGETGSVQSPVFDFTALTSPGIQVSIWIDAEFSWDGMVLQSSIDGGTSWQNVGALGDPVNWYNDGTILGAPGGQQTGWTGSGASGTGGWVSASHLLNGLGGQSSVLLRFAFGSDGSITFEGVAFDDINVIDVTCPSPSALAATSITATTADFGWTENGTATQWDIEYGPTGFIPTGIPTISGSLLNPTPITGLSGSTSYEYYVRADCGGSQSLWTGPFQFLTSCTVAATPWSDNVDGHTPTTLLTTSNCWNASATANYDWDITGIGTTPSFGTGANVANSGTNYFYTEASSANVGDEAILVTPDLDLSGLSVPLLQFSYHMFGNQIGTLNVEISNDFGATWNPVTAFTGAQQLTQADAWLLSETALGAYAGQTVRIRFRAVANGLFEGDICLDDINIIEAPTCPAPSALMVTASDPTTATFAWTIGFAETQWELEYGAPGFTPGTGTSILTNLNPETITGLTPDTFYELYLRAVCGPGDTSTYVGPVTFNTYDQGIYMDWNVDCGPGFTDISVTGTNANLIDDAVLGLSLPFSLLYQGTIVNDVTIGENGGIILGTLTGILGFGNAAVTGAADGIYGFWDDVITDNGGVFYETIGTAPNQQFIVQWNNQSMWPGGTPLDVITYQIIIDEATGEIYSLYADTEFAVGNFGNNGAGATIGAAGPNQDIDVSFNDPTFLENNSCIHYFYTDCPNPTDFILTYVDNDEAGITWSAGLAGETNWTVIYGPPGFDPAVSGTSLTFTSTVAIIPGLTAITDYDIYIFADCNPLILQSTGGLFATFTTLPNCSDVTGITTATATDSLFTNWSWSATPGYPSTGFDLQYGPLGFAPGTGTFVNADNNYTDTTADVTFMSGGVYEVYVQALCGGDSSNFVGPITFTMPLDNDAACSPQALPVDGVAYAFDNTGATTEVGEAAATPPVTGFNEVDGWGDSNIDFTTWFTFDAPPSGNIWISGKDVGFDGQVAIYSTVDCSDFSVYSLVGANDDAVDFTSAAPYLSICGLTPGNTYYLMHDSWSTTTTGVYSLSLTEIDIEAGTTTGLIDACSGDVVDLFNGIGGNDAGGIWSESIPTAGFADPLFASAGLAYQVYDFQYNVVEGCAVDSVDQQVQIYAPSSAGADGALTVCQNEPLNLLSALSGTVDLGGTWYDPSSTALPSPSITSGTSSGVSTYTYVASNGVCPADTANIVVTVGTCDFLAINELSFAGMSVFPNPTSGIVYISNFGSTEVFNYEVTDVKGKVISSKDSAVDGFETTEIDFEGMETGLYIIKVYNDNAQKTFRVVHN
ncbi:MAG: hypothetical protein ACI837_000006 [Crocinitomicaceae bacterium]|jgi:hypothetical protein